MSALSPFALETWREFQDEAWQTSSLTAQEWKDIVAKQPMTGSANSVWQRDVYNVWRRMSGLKTERFVDDQKTLVRNVFSDPFGQLPSKAVVFVTFASLLPSLWVKEPKTDLDEISSMPKDASRVAQRSEDQLYAILRLLFVPVTSFTPQDWQFLGILTQYWIPLTFSSFLLTNRHGPLARFNFRLLIFMEDMANDPQIIDKNVAAAQLGSVENMSICPTFGADAKPIARTDQVLQGNVLAFAGSAIVKPLPILAIPREPNFQLDEKTTLNVRLIPDAKNSTNAFNAWSWLCSLAMEAYAESFGMVREEERALVLKPDKLREFNFLSGLKIGGQEFVANVKARVGSLVAKPAPFSLNVDKPTPAVFPSDVRLYPVLTPGPGLTPAPGPNDPQRGDPGDFKTPPLSYQPPTFVPSVPALDEPQVVQPQVVQPSAPSYEAVYQNAYPNVYTPDNPIYESPTATPTTTTPTGLANPVALTNLPFVMAQGLHAHSPSDIEAIQELYKTLYAHLDALEHAGDKKRIKELKEMQVKTFMPAFVRLNKLPGDSTAQQTLRLRLQRVLELLPNVPKFQCAVNDKLPGLLDAIAGLQPNDRMSYNFGLQLASLMGWDRSRESGRSLLCHVGFQLARRRNLPIPWLVMHVRFPVFQQLQQWKDEAYRTAASSEQAREQTLWKQAVAHVVGRLQSVQGEEDDETVCLILKAEHELLFGSDARKWWPAMDGEFKASLDYGRILQRAMVLGGLAKYDKTTGFRPLLPAPLPQTDLAHNAAAFFRMLGNKTSAPSSLADARVSVKEASRVAIRIGVQIGYGREKVIKPSDMLKRLQMLQNTIFTELRNSLGEDAPPIVFVPDIENDDPLSDFVKSPPVYPPLDGLVLLFVSDDYGKSGKATRWMERQWQAHADKAALHDMTPLPKAFGVLLNHYTIDESASDPEKEKKEESVQNYSGTLGNVSTHVEAYACTSGQMEDGDFHEYLVSQFAKLYDDEVKSKTKGLSFYLANRGSQPNTLVPDIAQEARRIVNRQAGGKEAVTPMFDLDLAQWSPPLRDESMPFVITGLGLEADDDLHNLATTSANRSDKGPVNVVILWDKSVKGDLKTAADAYMNLGYAVRVQFISRDVQAEAQQLATDMTAQIGYMWNQRRNIIVSSAAAAST